MQKWKLTERTQATRADTFRQFILFAGEEVFVADRPIDWDAIFS
jgi:hypothetical protein